VEEVGMSMGSNWQAQSRVREPRTSERQTRWETWVVFAGVMLAVVGVLHVIAGLVALVKDEVYFVPSDQLVLRLDYTAWGWLHLALGAVALVAAFLLLRGNMVGRSLAVGFAVLSALDAFVLLHAQPWWSALIIALDVLIISAIVTHGDELRSPR
jgi:hypothetical protein